MDSGVFKGILITVMIIYIVSPIDLCPGPVDDIIVALLGIAATKKSNIEVPNHNECIH